VCRVTVLVIVSGFICHCGLYFQIRHLRGELEWAHPHPSWARKQVISHSNVQVYFTTHNFQEKLLSAIF